LTHAAFDLPPRWLGAPLSGVENTGRATQHVMHGERNERSSFPDPLKDAWREIKFALHPSPSFHRICAVKSGGRKVREAVF